MIIHLTLEFEGEPTSEQVAEALTKSSHFAAEQLRYGIVQVPDIDIAVIVTPGDAEGYSAEFWRSE